MTSLLALSWCRKYCSFCCMEKVWHLWVKFQGFKNEAMLIIGKRLYTAVFSLHSAMIYGWPFPWYIAGMGLLVMVIRNSAGLVNNPYICLIRSLDSTLHTQICTLLLCLKTIILSDFTNPKGDIKKKRISWWKLKMGMFLSCLTTQSYAGMLRRKSHCVQWERKVLTFLGAILNEHNGTCF